MHTLSLNLRLLGFRQGAWFTHLEMEYTGCDIVKHECWEYSWLLGTT